MGGYYVPEINTALPHADMKPNPTTGKIGDFNIGQESMSNVKIGADGRIPDKLMHGIEQMGKDAIALLGPNMLKTQEFAGAHLEGPDGKPDPKKVGALLFAAASIKERDNGSLETGFDNTLTKLDLKRLTESPEMRKQIVDIATNVEHGVLSTRDPLSVQMESKLKPDALAAALAAALSASGVSSSNEPVRPTPMPEIGGQGLPDGALARC